MPECNAATDSIPQVDNHRAHGQNLRLPPSLRLQGMPMLDRDGLLHLLNLLLECERAGTNAAILCGLQTDDAVLDSALFEVGCDEGRFCAMLTRHIERFGGAISLETGAFYQRLHAITDQFERLVLLNRGQEWVVRTLDEALPSIDDTSLKADLREMREAHVRNIGLCGVFITRLEPEKNRGGDCRVRRPH